MGDEVPKRRVLTSRKSKEDLPSLTVSLIPAPSTTTEDHRTSSASSSAKEQQAPPIITLLKVPTPLLYTDNTPTPVRTFLRDIEASGLFQDLKASPFDEHFRKAAAEVLSESQSRKSTVKAEDESEADQDGSLNTPQIFSFLESQVTLTPQPLNNLIASSSSGRSSEKKTGRSNCRAIAPASFDAPDGFNHVHRQQGLSSAAQLLLRLSSGQSIHLANVPVIQAPVQALLSPASLEDAEKTKRGRKRTAPLHRSRSSKRNDDVEDHVSDRVLQETDADRRLSLMERNRAAAKRSREKRKKNGVEMEDKCFQLRVANKNLATENTLLRNELARVKKILEGHVDCSVSRAVGQQQLIVEEIQPKLFAYQSEINPNIKVVKAHHPAAPGLQRAKADLVVSQIVQQQELQQRRSLARKDILEVATYEIRESSK